MSEALLQKGFTLIEMFVILVVMGSLLGVGWILLDPLEIPKRERDSIRIADLAILQQAIDKSADEASSSASPGFCNGQGKCQGASNSNDENTRKSNGDGWVRINLAAQKSVSIPTLPIDPINDNNFHYEFASDGQGWEIDAVLESKVFKARMTSDGGDNDSKYEIGTNLTLIN